MDGFTAIARVLIVVFGPLVGIIVLPLTEHTRYFVAFVNVGLIPLCPWWPTKDLVRVNVPILHPLNPVNTAVIGAKRLVNVAALVVIIRHIGVKFAEAISGRACEETFEDVCTKIV